MTLDNKAVASLRSHLKVKSTSIERARFPVVDMHSHLYAETDAEIQAWANLRDLGLQKVVLLTGQTGEEFRSSVNRYESAAPGFWLPFAGLLREGVGEDDYAKRAIEALDNSIHNGALGVGEIIDKGSGLFGHGVLFDHLCFDPVWEHCGKRGLPVSIHVGEPPAFYEPPDDSNELERSSRWSLYGLDIPSLDEMLKRVEKLFRRHPKTTFVLAHFGNIGNDLERLGGLLDRCPNIFTESSARNWELARQPFSARRFLIKYQERVVFGTDNGDDAAMYRQHIRFFETDDEWFSPPDADWWMGYGLHLPSSVLQKLYNGNAKRLLGGSFRHSIA